MFVVASKFNSEMQAMFCVRILPSLYNFSCGSDFFENRLLLYSILLQIFESAPPHATSFQAFHNLVRKASLKLFPANFVSIITLGQEYTGTTSL